MKTAQDRLKFAVEFAGMDLAALRLNAQQNLKNNIESFLLVAKEGNTLKDIGGVYTFPADFLEWNDFAGLQKDVRQVLSGLILQQQGSIKAPATPIWSTITSEARISAITFSAIAPLGISRPMLMARGKTPDVFLLKLFYLLGQEPTNGIIQCPECRTIFFRVGKQRFCSPRCANRNYMREYRKKDSVKAEEAERSHSRYKKRVEKKRGKPTRVERRGQFK
jgi:CGNR zinc finger